MSHYAPGAAPTGPIETKVKWASIASYLASVVLVALANALQDADHALVLGEIPELLESLLLPLLPALATFLAGYSARHTFRHDLRGSGGSQAGPSPLA